jgi:hypothetical protein
MHDGTLSIEKCTDAAPPIFRSGMTFVDRIRVRIFLN